MKLSVKGIIATALLSASSSALAVPVTGDISFSSLEGTGFVFDTTTSTFNFDDDVPNAGVNTASGDFANYFTAGDQVEFIDFSYAPFSGPKTIWQGTATVGPNAGTNLAFVLDRVNVEYETNIGTILKGSGVITDGVDEITGLWVISANKLGQAFSWSSSAAVPEPGTLALLGIGLAGLGAARRRKA